MNETYVVQHLFFIVMISQFLMMLDYFFYKSLEFEKQVSLKSITYKWLLLTIAFFGSFFSYQ